MIIIIMIMMMMLILVYSGIFTALRMIFYKSNRSIIMKLSVVLLIINSFLHDTCNHLLYGTIVSCSINYENHILI